MGFGRWFLTTSKAREEHSILNLSDHSVSPKQTPKGYNEQGQSPPAGAELYLHKNMSPVPFTSWQSFCLPHSVKKKKKGQVRSGHCMPQGEAFLQIKKEVQGTQDGSGLTGTPPPPSSGSSSQTLCH